MLIVKITPAWFDTCNVLLLLFLFWWLCRLCTCMKTLCEIDACSCDHIGHVACSCRLERQVLEISRDGANRLPPFTNTLFIKDCANLHIKTKSFQDLDSLSHVRLLNIKNLTLEQHSLSWNDSTIYDVYPSNGIDIHVENATVSNLPTYVFRGRIDSILFNRVRVNLVQSYAFTSLAGTKSIVFRECQFLLVENQAFKKFFVEQIFSIIGGSFASTLPSRTIMDVAVSGEFQISGVTFDRIRSSAFRVHGPRKFQLQNCYVAHIEGEAFVVHTRGPVFVDDNIFRIMETGAMLGFNVEKHTLDFSGHQEFVFENNTIAEVDRASLLFNINSFIPKLDWIYLNTQCECRTLPSWLSELIIYTHRYPEEKIPPKIKLDEIISCRNDNEYTRLKDYSHDHCGERTQPLTMVAFLSVIAVLVFLAVLVFYWVWYKNRKSRWINVPQSSPAHEAVPMRSRHDDPPSPCYEEPSTSRHRMTTDGGRNKETEMHVIVECSEPTPYVNPFRERTQIYSNRCIELGQPEYANRKYSNRHQLLTSDL